MMLFALAPVRAQSQSGAGDSARVANKNLQVSKNNRRSAVTKEFDLGIIRIEAIIEKPNVDIIPKRMQPRNEETVFLHRSFAKEIQEVPDELLLHDDELDEAKKLQGFQEILEKRSKKLKRK